jgi:hypothetical protein
MYNDEDDTAAPTAQAVGNWRIEVSIDCHPSAISRVLDPIVRQGVTPNRLLAEIVGDDIHVTLDFTALDGNKAGRLIALFQTLPSVASVTWHRLQSPLLGEIA